MKKLLVGALMCLIAGTATAASESGPGGGEAYAGPMTPPRAIRAKTRTVSQRAPRRRRKRVRTLSDVTNITPLGSAIDDAVADFSTKVDILYPRVIAYLAAMGISENQADDNVYRLSEDLKTSTEIVAGIIVQKLLYHNCQDHEAKLLPIQATAILRWARIIALLNEPTPGEFDDEL